MPRPLDAAAVAFAAVLPTAVTAVYFLALDDHPTWLQQTAWGLGKLVQFSFPLVWVLAVQGRRLRVGPGWRRGWRAGVGSGAIVFAAMTAMYYLWLEPAGVLDRPAVDVTERVVDLGLHSLARYLAFAAFLAVIHSMLEEYYFRWFVFGQMRRLMPLGPALAVASLAFAAHHVLVLAGFFGWASPLTWLGAAAVAAAGAFWAWLYERTGSLLGPWISHLLADVAILAVGYDLMRMF